MIELDAQITPKLVEHLHRRHGELARPTDGSGPDVPRATRAAALARSRNPKMLLVLEKVANILDAWADQESGRTRRAPDQAIALRVPPQAAQGWREAYRLADEGKDGINLGYIYLAVAEWLGML